MEIDFLVAKSRITNRHNISPLVTWSTKNMLNKNKYVYLELMRILAVFCVIFNHTHEDGFMLYTMRPTGSVSFWIYLIISILCKFAVPLFFMISGALLLCREPDSLKNLFQKRILKILIALLVFSLVYYMQNLLNNGKSFKIDKFIKTIYTSMPRALLWYMYSYIAFLISLPFLQVMVQHLQDVYFRFMISIAFVFNFLPVIDYILTKGKWGINGYLRPQWILTDIVLCPCIGYYLQHRMKISSRKVMLTGIWNLGCIAVCCLATYLRGIDEAVFSETASQNYYSLLAFVNAMSIFMLLKWFTERVHLGENIQKCVVLIGSCTFGIYLMHDLFMNMPIKRKFIDTIHSTGCNSMISCLIWCMIDFLICLVITWILKKIPLIRKLF